MVANILLVILMCESFCQLAILAAIYEKMDEKR